MIKDNKYPTNLSIVTACNNYPTRSYKTILLDHMRIFNTPFKNSTKLQNLQKIHKIWNNQNYQNVLKFSQSYKPNFHNNAFRKCRLFWSFDMLQRDIFQPSHLEWLFLTDLMRLMCFPVLHFLLEMVLRFVACQPIPIQCSHFWRMRIKSAFQRVQ